MAFHVSFAIEAGDLLDLVKTLQSIAVLVNNAFKTVQQSVKSCVRYLCRALARLQISSLSFALC